MKMVKCPITTSRYCEHKFDGYCSGCELYRKAKADVRRAVDKRVKETRGE